MDKRLEQKVSFIVAATLAFMVGIKRTGSKLHFQLFTDS